MAVLLDVPAEAGSIVGPGAVFTGLHQQLLRHAAHIDAGATPEPLLRYGNFGAVTGRDAGAPDAGRATANDEKIVVHAFAPLCKWHHFVRGQGGYQGQRRDGKFLSINRGLVLLMSIWN